MTSASGYSFVCSFAVCCSQLNLQALRPWRAKIDVATSCPAFNRMFQMDKRVLDSLRDGSIKLPLTRLAEVCFERGFEYDPARPVCCEWL